MWLIRSPFDHSLMISNHFRSHQINDHVITWRWSIVVIAPVVISGGDCLQTVEERIIIQAAQIFTDILKKRLINPKFNKIRINVQGCLPPIKFLKIHYITSSNFLNPRGLRSIHLLCKRKNLAEGPTFCIKGYIFFYKHFNWQN